MFNFSLKMLRNFSELVYPIIGREADKRGHYNFNTRAGNPTNFWTDSDSCNESTEKKGIIRELQILGFFVDCGFKQIKSFTNKK